MNQMMLSTGIGFVAVGCLTIFFSGRRRLFIRIFVPREELLSAMRTLREPTYGQGMKIMGRLQVAIGLGFVVIAALLGS